MSRSPVGSLPVLGAVVSALAACEPASIDVNYQAEVSEIVIAGRDTATGGQRLKVNWRVYSYGLVGMIENPNQQEAEILWTEARYTHDSVSEELIVANGATQIPPGRPQPQSVVPAGGTIEVHLLPRSKAAWREFTDKSGGFWYDMETLFGIPLQPDLSDEERQRLAERAVGEEFIVEIPVEVAGDVLVHLYRFQITAAEPHAAYY